MVDNSLLSRLQSATGPSRELDAEIALANGWTHQKLKPENGRGGDSKPYWRKPNETKYYIPEEQGPPRYTESIDAALTLKPKGYHIVLRWCDPPTDSVCSAFKDNYKNVYTGRAATPAIAILIAIERAKEDSKP